MDPKELRASIEAILLVAGEPVREDELAEAFPEAGREAVADALTDIERVLEESITGFALERAAGGVRFATRPELDPHLRKYFAKKSEGRLSMAALETLAIIAYRQPVTAPEISDIRGVNSSGVLRTLLERKMIRIAGRKNVVGSPFLYRTTREFLVHFGLNSLKDLPQLEEFAEVLGESLAEELLGGEPGEGMEDRFSDDDDLRSAGDPGESADDPLQPGESAEGTPVADEADEQNGRAAEDSDASSSDASSDDSEEALESHS